MRLDIYNHIFPPKLVERIEHEVADKGALTRMLSFENLFDVDARLRLMDGFGDYQQVLSLSGPPIEFMAGPDVSPELARLANDGMAEICRNHPDRFPGFTASLPMNNPDAMVKEIDRAIGELGACGVQIFSNAAGRPLDAPESYPLFEKMAGHDLPIWLHPDRGPNHPDYLGEAKSKYEIWFVFGWPYETSAAMARLVFAGLFDKLPNIKIIAHHMGAMIPYFEGRIGPGWDELGTRTDNDEDAALLESLDKRPLDYFRMFYADTALFGAAGATRCGLDFFGADHCLFATDCPFDPEGGPMYIRETVAILDNLHVSTGDRDKLYAGNARRLLRLD